MLKSVLCQRVKCYKSSLHKVCSNHTNQISYHEGKAELDSQFTTIVSKSMDATDNATNYHR